MSAVDETVGTGVSFELTAEQKALRELAHEFAEKEIRPKAAEYDEHQTHPADVIAKAHEVGLMNPHIPEELGGPGLGGFEGVLIGEELCWGCSGIGTSIVANILGALPGAARRHRGAEARVAVAAARGADPLLVRADRAERRLRRLGDPDHGRAPRRRVRHQRIEDVHHQRRARVLGDRLRLDRQGRRSPRPDRLRRPERRRGRHRREAPRQDGAARDRHLGARLPGREGAGRQPARRGGPGLQDRDADARPHAARDGRRRGRRRARRLRARGRVRAASASSSASRSR